MRKTLITIVALGLAVGTLVAPASAAKKKVRIQDSFQATALPFPNLSSATGTADRGCLAGQDGVHKVSHPFAAPVAGTLTASMSGFTGDWDLFITDASGKEIVGSLNDQIQGGAPAEEEISLALTAKQEVNITPCNWAGIPQTEVTFEFVGK